MKKKINFVDLSNVNTTLYYGAARFGWKKEMSDDQAIYEKLYIKSGDLITTSEVIGKDTKLVGQFVAVSVSPKNVKPNQFFVLHDDVIHKATYTGLVELKPVEENSNKTKILEDKLLEYLLKQKESNNKISLLAPVVTVVPVKQISEIQIKEKEGTRKKINDAFDNVKVENQNHLFIMDIFQKKLRTLKQQKQQEITVEALEMIFDDPFFDSFRNHKSSSYLILNYLSCD